MRKRTVASILLIMFSHVLCSQEPGAHGIALLNFDTSSAGDCSVRVNAGETNPNGPRTQVLTISCQGKPLLNYPTQDALVDLFLNYPHDDRVFARWEGGSHVLFTVFRVSGSPSQGTVVFDKKLEGAPDVVNMPDVLLVHSGKRWLSGQAASMPTSTDIYRWADGKYVLTESWKWNDAMRYEDRFCVLDVKALSCPVTPLSPK
jgi:hypothetical protein